MMTQNDKDRADVLVNVIVEIGAMFEILKDHYRRPEFNAGLPAVEQIELYVNACLADYSPPGT